MIQTKDFYKDLESFIKTKDFTLSGEEYDVKRNVKYDMLVTTPVPKDLTKYYESDNYISHTDSNKSLFDKLYQFVKRISLKKKLNLINSFDSNSKTILDIGAGTGDFLSICKKNQWNVFGTEPSKKARGIAKKKGIDLVESISSLNNNHFDVITLWHVLEHVENLSDYLVKLSDLLSEKGTLIIAVPNYKSYDAVFYKEYWAALDVPRHLWHFSKHSISKMFSLVNMKIEKTIPMKYDSYYVSILSEKYKTNKTGYLKGICVGLISNLKARRTKEYSSLIYVLKKV